MDRAPDRYDLEEIFGKQESTSEALLKKFKANPGLPIGVGAFIGIGLYGAYTFKNRRMRTSVFLINLRVAAQGTVVACLLATLFYKIGVEEIYPKLAGKK